METTSVPGFVHITWDKGRLSGDREAIVFGAGPEGAAPIALTEGRGFGPFADHTADNRFEEAAAHEFLKFAGEQLAGVELESNVSGGLFAELASGNMKNGQVALGYTLDGKNTFHIGRIKDMPEGVRELMKGAMQLHKSL